MLLCFDLYEEVAQMKVWCCRVSVIRTVPAVIGSFAAQLMLYQHPKLGCFERTVWSKFEQTEFHACSMNQLKKHNTRFNYLKFVGQLRTNCVINPPSFRGSLPNTAKNRVRKCVTLFRLVWGGRHRWRCDVAMSVVLEQRRNLNFRILDLTSSTTVSSSNFVCFFSSILHLCEEVKPGGA